MKLMYLALVLTTLLLSLPTSAQVPAAPAQQRIVVRSPADLPRHTYKLSTPTASELLDGGPAFDALAEQLRTNTEATLQGYDIQDRATLRGLYSKLNLLALLNGDTQSLGHFCAKYRELEEAQADKMTTCLRYGAAAAAMSVGDDPATRHAAVRNQLAKTLDSLPWDMVGDRIKSARADAAMPGKRVMALGRIQGSSDPVAKRTGEIGEGLLTYIIAERAYLQRVEPYRDDLIVAFDAYIATHEKDRPDIWRERVVTLTDADATTPVVVAVWDEGADLSLFKDRLWTNAGEQVNGRDDDRNGFIDDVHGIGYDEDDKVSIDLLADFALRYPGREAELRELVAGDSDTRAGLDTPAARAYMARMDSLEPQDISPLQEAMGAYMGYIHGTLVSSVAIQGNAAARLLTVRWSRDTYHIPPPVPTEQRMRQVATATGQVMSYLKANGTRVANMSWGATPGDFEWVLEANGTGDSPEVRRELAQKLFSIWGDALTEAIRGAPEILFIVAAGNASNDVEFTQGLPESLDFPNVLSVGAVDRAGQASRFTSDGKLVRIYANGEHIEGLLPGGGHLHGDGTSLSAPAVTNLAAKLFALDPALTPTQVVRLILDGASKSDDGKRLLIDPKRSVALLAEKHP